MGTRDSYCCFNLSDTPECGVLFNYNKTTAALTPSPENRHKELILTSSPFFYARCPWKHFLRFFPSPTTPLGWYFLPRILNRERIRCVLCDSTAVWVGVQFKPLQILKISTMPHKKYRAIHKRSQRSCFLHRDFSLSLFLSAIFVCRDWLHLVYVRHLICQNVNWHYSREDKRSIIWDYSKGRAYP